jgi:iron-sulfur cluster insertion protein
MITVTESARDRIIELLREENDDSLWVRAFVQGGGCSGFQYGFTFDADVSDDDFDLSVYGARILVDSISMQYLTGSTISWRENDQGASFVIENPNAVTTCGCGSSFSV